MVTKIHFCNFYCFLNWHANPCLIDFLCSGLDAPFVVRAVLLRNSTERTVVFLVLFFLFSIGQAQSSYHLFSLGQIALAVIAW